MRNYLSLIFLLAVAVSVSGHDTKPAADRVAAQNAIFDDYYESELRNFPERATASATTATTTNSMTIRSTESCSTTKRMKAF